MVNTSSPILQSLLVNIYRNLGILSYLRRSIHIPTNTGEEGKKLSKFTKTSDHEEPCEDISC